MTCPYATLIPAELRAIIASYTDDEDAVIFAVTCKTEYQRYLRTHPPETRLSFRQLMYRYYDQEAIDDLFPGEKGYEQAKKEWDASLRKIHRQEWTRPIVLKRKAEDRKERNRQKGRWKRGIYDD